MVNKELKAKLTDAIPKNWSVNTVENIAEKVTIGLVKTMTTNYAEKGVPLIRNSSIKENYINKESIIYLTEDFSNENSTKQLNKGDIVTVHTGDIGTSAVITKEFDGSQGFATLNTTVNKNIIFNYYLVWYFNSYIFKKQAYSLSTGDGRNNLNLKEFKKALVCYPESLKEQQKIAAILTSVDEAIEKTEQIIEQTETVKKGVMQQLLTKGIGHTEFKHTEVGEIPKEWEVIELGDIANFSQGIQVPVSKQSEQEYHGSVRFLRIVDYTQNLEENRYIDNPGTRYLVTEEDVVMVRYGASAGFIGTGLQGALANNLFKISPSDKVIRRFLFLYLSQEKIFKNLNGGSGASAMPAVNFGQISKLKIVMPSVKEQRNFVSIIEKIDNKILKERQKLTKLQVIKQGLMQQLLTGKVRVTINEKEEVPS